MQRQIKWIACFLIGASSLTLPGQVSTGKVVDPGRDSIQDALIKQLGDQLNSLARTFHAADESYRLRTDSLEEALKIKSNELFVLEERTSSLEEMLLQASDSIEATSRKLERSRTRLKRFGWTIFFVSLAAALAVGSLLFLLFRNYKKNTDYQLSTLRKYTYQEIEEVRSGMMTEVRKRYRKLRNRLKTKEKKKGKKKKSGKK